MKIINDVDVSGCQYYGIEKAEVGNWCSNCQNGRICEHQAGCYFKCWQREMKECALYKQALKHIHSKIKNGLCIELEDFKEITKGLDL
jgi:hypothetical protein